MNYYDFLAWLILAVTYVFGVIPIIVPNTTGRYLDALCIGLALHAALAIFSAIVFSFVWAVDRVVY